MIQRIDVEEFRPELRFDTLLTQIRKDMEASGLMQSLPRQRYELAIAREIEMSRDIVAGQLTRNWPRLFPGVKYDETVMLLYLEKALADWSKDATSRFGEILVTRTRLKRAGSRYFRPWDLRLLYGLGVSFLTIPTLLGQLFQPTDFQFTLGAYGLIANIAALGYLYYKASSNKKET